MLKTNEKSSSNVIWETIKIVIQALILAILVRLFLFQPFNIPSGSMKNTLLIGDYLFVSKYSYGYSKYSFPGGYNLFEGRIWDGKPKRGDVIVFKLPTDNETDYVKRLIGLPGDEVQMKGGQLFINGKAVPKVRKGLFKTVDNYGNKIEVPIFEETLPNGVTYNVLDMVPKGAYDDTNIFKVPKDHYFMMGDNRDNSTDSRAVGDVGFVPHDNLIGKAQILFFSKKSPGESTGNFFSNIRWGRIFNKIR